MIMTIILSKTDILIHQRTDQEVINLFITAPLLKRSKALTIAATHPTHRSLSALRPLSLAQPNYLSIISTW